MAWNDAMTFNPSALPPGIRVGSWQLLAWQGRGTYGTVYRATPWRQPSSGAVALKLASHPRDERFAREAELLLDYGAGHYVGAAPLPPPPFPPGSPRYRSPEAWAFSPKDEESRVWDLEAGGPRPPQTLNPSVDPRLGALILRMLAVRTESRGSAPVLAAALEQAAAHAGPEADQPFFSGEPRSSARWPSEDLVVAPQWTSSGPAPTPEHSPPPVQPRSQRAWLLTMGVGVSLAVCMGGGVCVHLQSRLPAIQASSDAGELDGGSVALGDTSLTVAAVSSPAPLEGEGIGLEASPHLIPGQSRPDVKGKCPSKGQVVLNGGCWIKLDVTHPTCQGNVYVYQGSCYIPALQPATVPTSGRH
ncbi:Protein kinase [Stigmatella aurantiaca DW4/3-1]|nr:Protein kinase [Stigmatella aurantiaca DW4/3-1]